MSTFSINPIVLKRFCEDLRMKSVPAVNEPQLVQEFMTYLQMHSEFLRTGKAYEVSSAIRSFNFWFQNKDLEPKAFGVKEKEVYYVDLGSFSLKYEEGFIHPCLVVKRFGTMALVIPGSSKKFGRKHFLIEPVSSGDGFRENTGLMIDQMRFISTTRIQGKKIGDMSSDTFKKIEDKLFESFLVNKFSQFKKIEEKLEKVNTENDELKKEIEESNTENDKLKKELEELKEKLKNKIETKE